MTLELNRWIDLGTPTKAQGRARAYRETKMVTAFDSPNPEKQKLSKRIADDIARFLENGGRIQVLPIQARRHPAFDMGLLKEARGRQRSF